MKKVLIFSLSYYPKHVGGAEVAIKEITDRISPDEIEFHMITNRYDSMLPKVSKEGNVIVHRIGFTTTNPSMGDLKEAPLKYNKYLFQSTAAFAAWNLNRTLRFDGMWAMMAHSCGVPAGIFKTFNPKIKYLLTLQEGDPTEYIEKLARPIWPLFVRGFRKADMVQAISTFLGKWARRMGFEGTLEIIPNAVDVARFSHEYSPSEIDQVKTALGKLEGDICIITTSRLVHKNAVDDMIRALPLLSQNIRFIVLGIGPDETMLKKLAADLQVSDRVQFLGQVNHTDMPKYLKASDIFIRASRSEGMGNSFVEAMAAGLPVIATQEGGIADFLFDARRNPGVPSTGFAVDKDSPEQIAKTIEEILAHPEQVKAVTAVAKRMVIEKYDWDLIARDMQEKVFVPLLS
jgi:glycosyltransferase involved in cell wall biosynthesis